MQTTKHVSFLIKVSGILLLSALLMGIRAAPVPAQAQGGISLVGQRMSYLFADSMGFEAKFESNSDFVDGHLIFQDPNEDEVQTFQADLRPDGLFAVQLSLQEDLQPKAFSTIRYWYVVATKTGPYLKARALSSPTRTTVLSGSKPATSTSPLPGTAATRPLERLFWMRLQRASPARSASCPSRGQSNWRSWSTTIRLTCNW